MNRKLGFLVTSCICTKSCFFFFVKGKKLFYFFVKGKYCLYFFVKGKNGFLKLYGVSFCKALMFYRFMVMLLSGLNCIINE